MQSVQKDRPSAVRISCYLEPPIILFRASLFTCKHDECAVRSLFFFLYKMYFSYNCCNGFRQWVFCRVEGHLSVQ